MAPFSGQAAAFGQEMLRGARMAIDQANAAGGIGGQTISLVRDDSRGDPHAAVQVARSLLGQGVVAVVGPATSAVALAAEGVFEGARVPMITPSANDPAVTASGARYVFRAAGNWDQEPAVLFKALTRGSSPGSVALVSDGSHYGQALAAAVDQTLAESQAKPVLERTISQKADISGLTPDLKSLAPNAVFYAGFAKRGAELARAMSQAGVHARLLMGDAAEDQALIAGAGSSADGILIASPPEARAVSTAAGFLASYTRRYQTSPSLYAISTYDATRLLLSAMRKTEGNRAGLRKALSAMTFRGAYWGRMSFDASGQLQGATYVPWTVKGGKFQPLPSAG